MLKKGFLFIAIFLFLGNMAWSQEVALTLDEAIAIALRDNRDILLKTKDVEQAKYKIAEANAEIFPTLTFTGSWEKDIEHYQKNVSQTPTQTTVKQYVYKGGEIINTIQYNGFKLEVSKALLDKQKLDLILEVKKGFYTLLLTEEFYALNQGILQNTKAHLNFVKERYESGQASQTEINKIESSLSAIEEVCESSKNQIESTQVLLNNLLYLEKDAKIVPKSQFHYEPKVLALDEAFLKAMKDRPEIKQYASQIEADKKAIEVAKAGSRPNIYVSWDYYTQSHLVTATGAAKGWSDYGVLGATFTWPIFDGWLAKAKVEQAIVDLKKTQLNKENAVRDIISELKNAYLAFNNSIAKIKSTESDIVFYKDNFSVIKQKYEQGEASSLELDDASLSYNVSMYNQKQAIYDYIVSKASFDKATGGVF